MPEGERRVIPLHTRILIGLVAGAAAGGTVNALAGANSPQLQFVIDQITDPIGQLFLRLLLLLVVPLVFSSLLLGVAGLGDLRRIGRIGVKSLIYTVIVSAISVVIGLTLANTIQPGRRVDKALSDQLAERYSTDAAKRVQSATATADPETPLMKVVKTIIPTNIFHSVGRETPDMLGLMFFTLFLGIAVTLVPRDQTATFLGAVDGLYQAVAAAIQIVM